MNDRSCDDTASFVRAAQLQQIQLILIDAKTVLRDADLRSSDRRSASGMTDNFGWSVRDNMGIRALRRAGYDVVFLTSIADAESRSHAEELSCDLWVSRSMSSGEIGTADDGVENQVENWGEIWTEIREGAGRRSLDLGQVMLVTDRRLDRESDPGLTKEPENQPDNEIEASLGAIVSTSSAKRSATSPSYSQSSESLASSVQLKLQAKSGHGALLELCHLLLPIRVRRSSSAPMAKGFEAWIMGIVLSGFLITAPALAQEAERIRFPEEELATESVLPVFDQPVSVKSRNVELASRLELGLQGGYAMTEPFFNPLSFGLSLAYHFNEEWGAQVMYNTRMQGLSSEASQLNPIPNTSPPVNANLQYAPAPKALAIANVQYSAYYGKISLSKEMVMNLHLFGLAGAGMITLGDVQKPLVTVGLGQKFYFNDKMSFRFDLRLLAYQGPDPTSIRLDNKFEPQPSSAFSNRVFIEGFLTAGLSYALPVF